MRQPNQCNSWMVYPSGVTDLSSVQIRHKHCGARLTTEQQANQCQQSHLMELWLNERHLRYLWIHFDRMLTHIKHVETTALKCIKGLTVLKAIYYMAGKGIEQRHLFLLYQSVVLSAIDYGLGLTTMAQTNLLKLDRVQNEAMRGILRTTKGTTIETMRFMLDLPPMQTRQKVEQVKYTSVPSKIPTTHPTKS